jgi:hypothetical protein
LPRLAVYLPVLALAVLGAAPTGESAADAPDAAGFETTVQPFLEDTCLPCHNDRRKRGGLNLAAFQSVDSVARDPNLWEQALAKDPQRRDAALKTIRDPIPTPWPPSRAGSTSNSIAWTGRRARPGTVTIRRLNRTEYNNTNPRSAWGRSQSGDDFPQDDSGYGFDNIGDVLSVSPVLMERYLLASERVARTAVFGPEPRKPTLERKNAGPRKIVESTEVPEDVRSDRPEPAQCRTRHAPVPGGRRISDSRVRRRHPAGRVRAGDLHAVDRRSRDRQPDPRP